MKTEEIRKGLGSLFTRIQAREGERIVFVDDAIGRLPSDNPLYKIVSTAQRESEHGFNFSYTIAEKAVDAIVQMYDEYEEGTATFEEAREGDTLNEAITMQVPIMCSELAEIVQDVNSWDIVNESLQMASGTDDAELGNVLTYAWHTAIENMATTILDAVVALEGNDATV